MPKLICLHTKLEFGSGDYYIFCTECGRYWAIENDDDTIDWYDTKPRIREPPGEVIKKDKIVNAWALLFLLSTAFWVSTLLLALYWI